MRRRNGAAVETEPGGRIDELALAVDEISDPQPAIAQEDRHFAALVMAQQLTLDGSRETRFRLNVQCVSSAAFFVVRASVCYARTMEPILQPGMDEVVKELCKIDEI
jgi:hypothetical protein